MNARLCHVSVHLFTNKGIQTCIDMHIRLGNNMDDIVCRLSSMQKIRTFSAQ